MSFLRAILIVGWCLTVAVVHVVAAYWAIWVLPFQPGLLALPKLYFQAVAVVSLMTALMALLAILYVKAMWVVMGLAVLSAGLAISGASMAGVPHSALLIILLGAQLVLSRGIIHINAMDNPGQIVPDPAKEF